MNIVNFYYNKTRDIISKINLTALNFDYMNWLVLDSIKSVFLLFQRQKDRFIYINNIVKKYENFSLKTYVKNEVLCLFIQEATQELISFLSNNVNAENLLKNICSQLSHICKCTHHNNNDANFWATTEYQNNIPDSNAAKDVLVNLYLFYILLFFYCVQQNAELFTIFTSSEDKQNKKINILDKFYRKSDNQKIQFFLPLESDVTLSYFLYRYILNDNIKGRLGDEWAMGNTQAESVPSKIIDIIRILNSAGKQKSENGIKNETFHSWINSLNKHGIFETPKIKNTDKDKLKILYLKQYISSASWNDHVPIKPKLDLIRFIQKPISDFFPEFDSNVITDASISGTILASELMKELPIEDVFFVTEKCLCIELGIQNIMRNLEVLHTNGHYDLTRRQHFINDFEYFYKGYQVQMRTNGTNELTRYNPILALFIIYNTHKAESCLNSLFDQLDFANNHFNDLILSVFPDFDDNPELQKEIVIFNNLTDKSLSDILSNIDITFSSPKEAIKALGRLTDFFRLYFPEKYFIDHRCTKRDIASVYELLDEITICDLPNDIKKAFSAKKEAHSNSPIIRRLAIAKIEMHHMSANYNSDFIPDLLRILELLKDNTEMNTNGTKISYYENRLYDLCNRSLKIIFLVEQLCRYLFGRTISGEYASDFLHNAEAIYINPCAKDIFNDYYLPRENMIVEYICKMNQIPRSVLYDIWYNDIKK